MKTSDQELDFLMQRRPNIYGNTFVIALLKLLASLLIFGFAGAGVWFSYEAGASGLNAASQDRF